MSTIRVGSGFLRRDLFSAVTAARPGDVLVLDAGTYEVPDGFTIGNLVMTGAGERTEVVIETAFNVTGHLKMSNLTLRSAPFKTAIHVNGQRARVDLENVDVASDPTARYVGIWVDRGSLTMAGSRIWTSSSKDTPLGTSVLVEAGASIWLTDTHCGSSIVQLKRGTGTLSNAVMGCLLLEDASRVTSRDVVQMGNAANKRVLVLAGESTCSLATLRTTDAWTEGVVENSLLRLASFLPAPGAETEKVVLHTSGRGLVHAPDDIVHIVDDDEPDRAEPAPAAPTVHTWRADAGLDWAAVQSQLREGDTLLLEEGEYTIPDAVVLDFDLQGKGRAGNIRLTASLSAQDGTARSVANLTLSGLPEHNYLRVSGGSEVTLSSVQVDQRGAAAFYPVHVEDGRLMMDGCELTGRSEEDFAASVNVAGGELVATSSEVGAVQLSDGGTAQLSDCGFSGIFADENTVVESHSELRHHLEPGKFACVVSTGARVELDRVVSDDPEFAVDVRGGTFAMTELVAADGAYVRVSGDGTVDRVPDWVEVLDAEGDEPDQTVQTSSEVAAAAPAGDDPAPAPSGSDVPPGTEDETRQDEAGTGDPMAQIDALLGLQKVKKQIRSFLQTVEFNRAREAQGLPGVEMTLHSMFLGGPGTGKTTVARLLGQALHEAGVIPSAKFREVDPEKLISPNIGETAQKTRAVLDDALGGLLFIDEAYGLHQESGTNYGQQAVDTILKFMEDHRSEIVVVFAGYADKMQGLLGMNPGLRSRIPNEFEFEDYTDSEIVDIGLSMLAAEGYTLDEELYGQIIRRKYAATSDRSNGRWIRNRNEELQKVLISRVVETGASDTTSILDEDLHTFAGGDAASKEDRIEELLAELDGMLGLEPVKEFVRDLTVQVQADRRLARAGVITSQPSYHMVFAGGPGTGKTTVARIIAGLFHALGILERSNVEEVNPSRDLIGRYIGQTEQRTSQVIDQAMGGVLFIDEAYQMSSGDSANDFGPKALETLLTALENNRSSFVTIFAGYTADMEQLLDRNPGLRSRVPHRITFPDYTPDEVGIIAADRLAKSWEVNRDLVREVATQRYLLLPDEERGNARWARTFAESIEQAHRRWILEHDVPDEELRHINDQVVESYRPAAEG